MQDAMAMFGTRKAHITRNTQFTSRCALTQTRRSIGIDTNQGLTRP